MPLPIEVEKAIADEKSKRGYGNEHDLAELMEKQKAPPPKEEKKEEKKEEAKKEDEPLGKVATELLSKRLGYTRKTKKEEDEKKEEAKKEDVAADVGDDKSKEGEPKGKDGDDAAKSEDDTDKPKPKAKISKKPDIDPIEIASAAAARTAQAFMDSAADSRQKAVADQSVAKGVEDALSDEEKGELEVFREMSKDPKFKELPRQYLAYLKKAEDYQRQWEKDHPTEEFNPDAGDHDQFYAKHQPKYPELKYKEAIAEMVSRRTSNKEIEELKAEQKRLKMEAAKRDLEPLAEQTITGALVKAVEQVDRSILDGIKAQGSLDKYAEENPIEAEMVEGIRSSIRPFVKALLAWDHPTTTVEPDPNNEDEVRAHKDMLKYLRAKEEELRNTPWRERLTEGGKVLVSRAEYFSMNPTQKASHAYLDTVSLLHLKISEEAEKAKATYEKEQKKLESLAKRRGWSPPSRTENGHKANEEKAKKEDKSEETREEHRSPEAGSSSRIDTSGEVKKGASKDLTDLTADILFQRR